MKLINSLSPLIFLVVISWVFRLIIKIRKWLYAKHIFKSWNFPIPIIIIGNITLGGTGKTPLVIEISNWLKNKNNFSPGIISRGYLGNHKSPTIVTATSDAALVGDEAVLIHKNSKCPMVVGVNRVKAVKLLLDQYPKCNIIISDDGLQHYAIGRNLEIAVINHENPFGNKLCIPAGPLREPISRLKSVDFIISSKYTSDNNISIDNYHKHNNKYLANMTAYPMHIKPKKIISLINNNILPIKPKSENKIIHGVAGIARPKNFFNLLKSLGYIVIEHAFADHYWYKNKELHFDDNLTVLMTEKDAVKYMKFADSRHCFLQVTAQLNKKFYQDLENKLKNNLENKV